ncbi:capsular biosynthesis protein [Veillonella denticariosi JCM 15641]|uniref:non-specific protein-tyrosine kinase n=1 Tax=Veillonella denticariosi JCM 15641 TaxID=1298594 RepID=A0A2S7Z6J2_9FIRM|nr:CpsD/CapB family tyrosine-protein kinase [Veillonella denticariosi]PQL18896.1 capsular biosynthesis protein [Veillonella denticariosi JCM 15641]
MIRLISKEHGDTPFVEAYRTLRSNLQYVCNRKHGKLICITAATSGEGTSEVAANVALSLSKNNDKVLLVDGNLRNPIQHVAFDVQNRGLTNAVLMDEDLTIHRNVEPHLDILAAGDPVERPSDVVDSSKLPTILNYVRDEYDVIIVDTPPVLAVTDAVVLAEKSDGVIIVARNGGVSPDDLKEAKKRLTQVGVPLLGSIVIDA